MNLIEQINKQMKHTFTVLNPKEIHCLEHSYQNKFNTYSNNY